MSFKDSEHRTSEAMIGADPIGDVRRAKQGSLNREILSRGVNQMDIPNLKRVFKDLFAKTEKK
jgi:hypothetical protein